MRHVVENVESAGRSGPGTLSADELGLIERVRQKYRELGFIGCTNCRYCVPCPEGVAIPEIFAIFNEFYAKDRDDAVKARYSEEIAPESMASKCVKCGTCEGLCPQQLPIRDLLTGAVRTFEGRR